ncbi:MAG TPA: sugar phosphate isomerase/epimerase [Flavobacteriaceae bacterium]|nr:sugar phosphate isomerase/epimerase [Flavobacteriaceae bacterium]
MKRKTFIKLGSSAYLASLMPFSCIGPTPSKRKMGLQLYTVRDAMERDVTGTLKALKAMGYTNFESYGYDVTSQTYYGMSPEAFKQLLTDLELTTNSGHYGFADHMWSSKEVLLAYTDACIEGASRLGDEYIVWPIVREADRNLDGFKKLAEQLSIIGERTAAAGMGFAYHNFGYEFEQYEEFMPYEYIIQQTDPAHVQLEVDFYWVSRAGVFTPKEIIELAPGRYPLWHIKDMDKVTQDYTELGNGSIDYTTLMPDPERAGLKHHYIEQGGNFVKDSMSSVAQSAAYFQKELKHFF